MKKTPGKMTPSVEAVLVFTHLNIYPIILPFRHLVEINQLENYSGSNCFNKMCKEILNNL